MASTAAGTAVASSLPDFWTEERDPQGRVYYSNHQTKETTWERPEPSAPTAHTDPPPPYGVQTAAPPVHQQQPTGPCCTPKFTFWISCALGLLVWTFAIGASVDDDWLEGEMIAAGDEGILDDCSNSDVDFCDLYEAFTAMQFIAMVLASVAVAVLTVTPFRPSVSRWGSVKALGLTGGMLMAAFAFFQMLAFALMIAIEKELDNGDFDAHLGGTFAVAVMATLLGVVQAGLVVTFARSSGDGIFYKCFHDCMVMNQQQQQPQQQAHPPAAVSTAPPPAPAQVVAVAPPGAPSTSS